MTDKTVKIPNIILSLNNNLLSFLINALFNDSLYNPKQTLNTINTKNNT